MRLQEARQRRSHGAADVEAGARAAQITFTPPAPVSIELIDRIEPTSFDQTRRQAQSHRGVICPLAGLKVKRSTADQIADGRECAGRREFECGA